jgi:hypothetical protein
MRGDCSFFYIGGIVYHHSLNFLLSQYKLIRCVYAMFFILSNFMSYCCRNDLISFQSLLTGTT